MDDGGRRIRQIFVSDNAKGCMISGRTKAAKENIFRQRELRGQFVILKYGKDTEARRVSGIGDPSFHTVNIDAASVGRKLAG